jgi:hypothetical protein
MTADNWKALIIALFIMLFTASMAAVVGYAALNTHLP